VLERDQFLAFDVGGTRLKAGIVSATDGSVVASGVEETRGKGAQEVLAAVVRMGHDLSGGADLGPVGLCIPGLVAPEGKVLSLPGKLQGMVGRDLTTFLVSEFGGPAVVVNDAVAYGVGEATLGAGKGYARVVVMTIGSGVGVAVVQDQVPVTGGPLGGGILGGHLPISEKIDGPADSNGRPDTIEALCCAQRLIDYANESGARAGSTREVYEASALGRPEALRGIELYQEHLTRAVVALAHAHAPDAIVIGGGLMTADNPITGAIEDPVNKRLFGSYKVAVKTARLGDTAALCGLACLHSRRSATA
jgi:glucokinase